MSEVEGLLAESETKPEREEPKPETVVGTELSSRRPFFRITPALLAGGIKQISGLHSKVEVIIPGERADGLPDLVVDVSNAVRTIDVRLGVGEAAALALEVLSFELDGTPGDPTTRREASERYLRHVEAKLRDAERKAAWLRAEVEGTLEELVDVSGSGGGTGAKEFVSPVSGETLVDDGSVEAHLVEENEEE